MRKDSARHLVLRVSAGKNGVEKFEVQKNVPDYVLDRVHSKFGHKKSSNPINYKIVEFYKSMLCHSKINSFWRYIDAQVKFKFENEDRTTLVNHLVERLLDAYLRTPPVLSNFDSYSRVEDETEDGYTSVSNRFRKRMTWAEVEADRKAIIRLATTLRTKVYEAPTVLSRHFEEDMDIMAILPSLEKLSNILKQIPSANKVVSSRGKTVRTGSTTIKSFAKEALTIFHGLTGKQHHGNCVKITNLLYPIDRKAKNNLMNATNRPMTEDVIKGLWREMRASKSRSGVKK